MQCADFHMLNIFRGDILTRPCPGNPQRAWIKSTWIYKGVKKHPRVGGKGPMSVSRRVARP